MPGITRKTFLRLGAVTVASGILPATARADQLADIIAAKKLRIASFSDFPPYGMMNAQMKLTGSDIEVGELLAKDLGLAAEFVPSTNATRISNLQTNKADIIICGLSITAERAKVIDYSLPYAALRAVVGGRKDLAIKGMDDLKGKTVGVTRGSVTDVTMTAAVGQHGFTLRRYDDDATTITAALSGQVNVVASAGNFIDEIASRDKGFETKFEQASYDLAFGLRKGEPALKSKVDDWIRANLANGKLNAIYRKYHNVDIPDRIKKAGA